MSIIYEALKKVSAAQGNNTASGSGSKPSISRKDKIKLCLICILIIAFGFFFANIFFSIFINPKPVSPDTKDVAKAPVVKKDKPTVAEHLDLPALPIADKALPPPKETAVSLPSPTPDLNLQEEKLILSGVFFSQEQGYALINDQIVQVGDTVSGALVKSITLEGVKLDVQGKTIELRQ